MTLTGFHLVTFIQIFNQIPRFYGVIHSMHGMLHKKPRAHDGCDRAMSALMHYACVRSIRPIALYIIRTRPGLAGLPFQARSLSKMEIVIWDRSIFMSRNLSPMAPCRDNPKCRSVYAYLLTIPSVLGLYKYVMGLLNFIYTRTQCEPLQFSSSREQCNRIIFSVYVGTFVSHVDRASLSFLYYF